jgi:hypothetical protein
MSNHESHDEGKLSRRTFLQRSAAASLSPTLLGVDQFAHCRMVPGRRMGAMV